MTPSDPATASPLDRPSTEAGARWSTLIADRLAADRRSGWLAIGFVLAPLLATGLVVAFKPWAPVLDLAMTELRVRDVGTSHTPLIGLPGRIGTFPDQGSHAGPWYFYLIAPLYRLTGSRSWGLEFAMVAINIACLAAMTWLAARRFGRAGIAAAIVVAAVVVRGYSMVVLAQPWNPYFPVLVWALGLVAAILVFDGDAGLAPLVVVTTSLAAQTHVPYLTPAVAVNVAVLGWLLYRRNRLASARPLWFGIVAAAVMWFPPLLDQVLHRPGNLKMMFDHFTGPQDEPMIGLRAAFSVVTQHLNIVASAVELVADDTPFIERASDTGSLSVVGLLVLVGWLVAAGWVVRSRHRSLYPAFAMTGLLLIVDWFSISRIFGKVWFYLTLWMPITALLVWATMFAAAWCWWTNRAPASADTARPDGPVATRPITARPVAARQVATSQGAAGAVLVGAVIVVVLAVPTWIGVIDYRVPEGQQGAPVLALMPDVVAGLDSNVGVATARDGTYVIYWHEAILSGSQGLALLNELDRRGYRVGVDDTWRVPATQHRVLPPEQITAQVRLVSGPWIETLKALDGVELLGSVDLRSERQRARFEALQARVIERLDEIGRADLVPSARTSIFSLSLQELPADIATDLDEMIEIGVPVAVFIAPPDTPIALETP